MTVKNCEHIVYSLLNDKLNAVGYFGTNKRRWIKKSNEVVYEVTITFDKFGNDFQTYLSFSVIHFRVQQIVSNYLDVNEKNKKNIPTVKLFLLDLVLKPDINYLTFHDEEQLINITLDYYYNFIVDELPNLTTKYLDLHNILALFIDPKEKYYGKSHFRYIDMLSSIAIANIICKENFKDIVDIIEKEFKENERKFPYSYEVEVYGRALNNIISDLSR